MKNKTTVDHQEVIKFSKLSNQWWDADGPFKTLHDINPARLEFMTNYISLAEKTVLDVGCGGGIMAEGMAVLGANVLGLDVDKEIIAAAKEHSKGRSLNLRYLCKPIENYTGGPYDVVTCMEMLEHVMEPELIIENCARLLKEGGYLFLSTINRTIQAYLSVIIAAEYVLHLLPRQTHDYDKFIRPSELSAMVRRAGLEIIGLSGLAYNPCTRQASLQSSVQSNYLLACRKMDGD